MPRRTKPNTPTALQPRLMVPTTQIDPARLPHGENQGEAERMLADLMASGDTDWVEAPDLIEMPSYIQMLVNTATAPNCSEHRKETRAFRHRRKDKGGKFDAPTPKPMATFDGVASQLSSTAPPKKEKSLAYSSTEKEAWAAHLKLVQYRERCEAEHREMHVTARIYFEEKMQTDSIRGRPEEWGPRSDALRYAAALELGYTPQEASQMLPRHAARIRRLAMEIPKTDIELQIGLGSLPPKAKS